MAKGGCAFIICASPIRVVSFDMANIRVDSAVLVEKNDMVLLGRGGQEPDYGALVVPSGGVEYGEDFRETAYRETKEKTGIEIKNLRQIGAYQIVRKSGEPDKHRIIIFWRADYASGEIRASGGLLDAKFYTRAALKKLLETGKIKGVTLEVLKDSFWV